MATRQEAMRAVATTHGLSGTPTYTAWKSMRQRCSSRPGKSAKWYTGVQCCARWADFTAFLEDMGEKPEGLTLDRLRNAEGYHLGNCRWATAQQQAANRSTSVLLAFGGRTLCVAEWARAVGISRKGLVKRLKLGWGLDRALQTPKRGPA